MDWSIFGAYFICSMEHSQYFSIVPMMHLWSYKSDYISLFYEVSLSSLSALYKGKESELWDGIILHTNSMILKVLSQQLLYTSLEQHGTKSEEEGLNTTQREEMKR